ncbi:MAG: biotin--[acetyl-CoA-carboxylase] ligase [Desulfobulbaceae bacterium]|jgi:BirA family biotin operon repressor/biotin-[acetyl-CoA-carboxylase] ligase|nr:biotin--[acetyl-CoA-carboxylase] ligase [Desulfobulbaceae bacterium]
MSKFEIVAETGSTNDDVLTLARQGAAHGTALLALSQHQGRGRLGRHWHSPATSGLYGSVLLRPQIERQLYPRLALVAGVAAATAIEEETSVSPQLKWPNDLYLGGKKCGGILIEAFFTSDGDYAVVGIGINCGAFTASVPEEVRQRAGALWQSIPPAHHREALFAAIHRQLLAMTGECAEHGFAQILARWRQRDGFYGQQLAWAAPNGGKIIGKSAGIDEEGNLLLIDELGHSRKIDCGEVQPAAL